MICPSCSKDFEPSQTQQKFCSKRCKNRASNAKIAAQRKTDPEAYQAYKKALYARDPEAAAKRIRDWRAANPEKARAIDTRSLEKNRDLIYARNRASHHQNKEQRNGKRKILYRSSYEDYPWLFMLRAAKIRAAKLGIPYSLTEEWATQRWTGRCELTGIPFVVGINGRPHFHSPSLDQVTPRAGYTPDNCRFIIWSLNQFKGIGTDEDMYRVAQVLVSRHPTK